MSWKPEFQVGNDDNWYANALVFATREEAQVSADSTFNAWTSCAARRIVESDAAVNYRIVDNRMEEVE